MTNIPPTLPQGAPSALNALSETFSFHKSPEQFIASRALVFHSQNSDAISSRKPIRANILNRNVAVVSSHRHVKHILLHGQGTLSDGRDEDLSEEGERSGTTPPAYVATAAYAQFMGPFFPGPNVLLAEGKQHTGLRRIWEERLWSRFGDQSSDNTWVTNRVFELTSEHFDSLCDPGRQCQVDLYPTLKTLCWKILLGLFLDLRPENELFREIEALQEDLLRGQFSVFPVSVNLPGLWQSPRSKGIAAKTKIQKVLASRLRDMKAKGGGCPFKSQHNEDVSDMANHVLLFTSSLSVKALASLMTAFLLNIFLAEGVYERVREDERNGGELLSSILLETERLSPPIVGIMRRATTDSILPAGGHREETEADTLIPEGWDVWLYFVSAGRDQRAFGDDHEVFRADRFLDPCDRDKCLSFSAGKKVCLGRELVRDVCLGIARTLLREKINVWKGRLQGEVKEVGVRGWLGWEVASPEDWARDMRQLPTQHPARPLVVTVERASIS